MKQTIKDNLFKDLAIFKTVVESENYSVAAEKLGINPSSVSRTIVALEDYFAKSLIIRDSRILSITEDGVRLYQTFLNHEQKFTHLLDQFAKTPQTETVSVNISIPSGIIEYALSQAIPGYLHENPHLTINLHVQTRDVNIIAEQYDFAIFRHMPKQNMLKVRKLFTLNAQLYCSKQYAQKNPIPTTLDGLAKHLMISRLSNTNKPLELVYVNNGQKTLAIPVKARLFSTNLTTDKKFMLSDKVIACGTDFMYKEELATGKVIKILPEYSFSSENSTFYMITNGAKHRSSVVEHLIDFIIQSLAKII